MTSSATDKPFAATRVGHSHQLHIWLHRSDYEFLAALAEARHESISAMIRQMIRAFRRQSKSQNANV
jgi:hypothetical protein